MTPLANPIDDCWAQVMTDLALLLEAKNVHVARVVVLVPYAQLIQQARTAWADFADGAGRTDNVFASGFVPRFETTMNWASALQFPNAAVAMAMSPEDLQMDAALDALTAASLLQRAGLAAQQNVLAARLVKAAYAIARLAAAQPPQRRMAWGAEKALGLGVGLESPALVFELATAQIALAWAAASSYSTDVLFDAALGCELDLLVVIDGFQSEPLSEALAQHFGDRCVKVQLKTPAIQGVLALRSAQDLEDEAHLATACVLAHLAAGRSPVALVAQDRVLTRRVTAMLGGKGVAVVDETGWKLSTTRAAAALFSLMRALPWDAPTDAVLNWLKNAPAFDAADVSQLELTLRKKGVGYWRGVLLDEPNTAPMLEQVAALRAALQATRPLADWLSAVRLALQTSAQWLELASDIAGIQVIEALHMAENDATVWASNPRMSLQDFTAWVNQTLEAASFKLEHPPLPSVVVLPLSQLLGRPVQAVVLPGCDEARLPVSPEPPGQWTPAQRVSLGLISRVDLARGLRAAWNCALTVPYVDLLWRASEGGESLMPSGFVQELLMLGLELSADPRLARHVHEQPTPRPEPNGQALPVTQLSASAYEDLRRCPYRFFALRQLKLQESDELENELGKREFGNWLHELLHRFHEALKSTPDQDLRAQEAMINIAADEAVLTLGLTPDQFLPFAASWPRVRSGYLDWLATHQATGAVYTEGEVWKHTPLGKFKLVGKIDRIDQLPDGSRWVMDYKTEPATNTKARIDDAGEDTQLAFYAALLEDDTLAAAYVSLGEKEPTKTYAQAEIVELRDDLIGGILNDMAHIADGAPLLALGEGKACEYCAARGLCRKDFW